MRRTVKHALSGLRDSLRFVMDLLDRALVGVAPGIDFGDHAEGYLRFSYCVAEDKIEEGLGRIKKYLEDLPRS